MEDIFEGIIRGIFKFIIYIIKDVFVELIIKGTGYLIVRCYRRKSDFDPDGLEVVIWGLFFWGIVLTVSILTGG